ncbi:hypothetical protein GCM10023147_00270 [Tsukamurella soli]|uniref:ABC transporter domain-containing protein n=1 Tax=Tsukamurella soli TaxID=644556 RepID=A0ABP8J0S9_9ACTN
MSRRAGARQIAEAAALADVGAVLCLIAQVFPIAGGLALAACFPFAVVGLRHRLRTIGIALAAGAVIAFVLGGTSTVTATVAAAAVGGLVGVSIRRRWSQPTLLALTVPVLALPAGAAALVGLAALPGLREVAFKTTRSTWTGAARLLTGAGLGTPADAATAVLDWSIRNWPIAVPLLVVVAVVLGVWLVRASMGHALVAALRVLPRGGSALDTVIDSGAPPGPVPVAVRDVRVRFGEHTALQIDRFDLAPGELVSVTGRNGAGKSTLARVVAGVPPTAGTVVRPGPAGLGAPGGTAIVFQRPESQVLGVRVADDLWFGRIPGPGTDVDGLLARVGLAGMQERETVALSGGQLQRLAIASALAREPALLISDESTAMLDTRGRADVMALYQRVAAEGTAVLHITHHEAEARAGDRVVTVGPASAAAAQTPASEPPHGVRRRRGSPTGTLVLDGVGYVRDGGTPWDRPVLSGVDLTVLGGTATAVIGENGAGKSTLAWLMAGLLKPTAGTVTVDGEPVADGAVRIAVQHARLQVLRATVGRDVADAAGLGDPTDPTGPDGLAVRRALRRVGLDPDAFVDRRADELSGGEQRRVVLAGLLAGSGDGAGPRVLVLDEPLAGLDAAATTAMIAALRSVKASGTTLVIVTHDLPGLGELVDGVYEVRRSTAAPSPRRARHGRPDMSAVLGRPLPHPTPAHRVWVGTKLAVLAAMGVVIGVWTDWWVIGASAVLLAGWFALAGAPWRAVPRLPRLFGTFALISLVLTGIGSGATTARLLGVTVNLSGVDVLARGLAATLLSLAAALLFCWTTPLGQLPGFLQQCLDRFGRLGRASVATATAVALAVRLGPLVLSEVQTMWRLAQQRRRVVRRGRRRGRRRHHMDLEDLFEMLTLTTVQSCRRAGELADAIASRGGIGAVARPADGPTRLDILVALAAAAVLGVGVALGLTLPGMVN